MAHKKYAFTTYENYQVIADAEISADDNYIGNSSIISYLGLPLPITENIVVYKKEYFTDADETALTNVGGLLFDTSQDLFDYIRVYPKPL